MIKRRMEAWSAFAGQCQKNSAFADETGLRASSSAWIRYNGRLGVEEGYSGGFLARSGVDDQVTAISCKMRRPLPLADR
jgi:hypothetical protein